MIIDPLQYTELIEEVRTLKALNDALTFENETLLKELMNEKREKDNLQLEFIEFKEKIQLEHQELLQSCKQQVALITNELSTKKQEDILYFQNKIAELEKGSHQRLKALEIEFKDFRLKSHLNDEFVNKVLKLYPENHNPGLPELYTWIKKMISKDKIIPEQNHFVVSEKENRKIMPKNLQKDKSKKKLLDCTK